MPSFSYEKNKINFLLNTVSVLSIWDVFKVEGLSTIIDIFCLSREPHCSILGQIYFRVLNEYSFFSSKQFLK